MVGGRTNNFSKISLPRRWPLWPWSYPLRVQINVFSRYFLGKDWWERGNTFSLPENKDGNKAFFCLVWVVLTCLQKMSNRRPKKYTVTKFQHFLHLLSTHSLHNLDQSNQTEPGLIPWCLLSINQWLFTTHVLELWGWSSAFPYYLRSGPSLQLCWELCIRSN